MKVTPNYTPINHQTQVNKPRENYAGGKIAFQGGFTDKLKSAVPGILDKIDRKGFFAEFLVIDTISMIIPRILVGLGRDKEKTGKVNYKAGAEEAGREILSGPSMFLIPLGMLEAAKAFMPAVKVAKNSLPQMSEMMKEVVSETANKADLKDATKLKQAFSDKIFESAFQNHDLDNRAELKKEFFEIMNKGKKSKVQDELSEFVSKVNNSNKNVNPNAILDTKSLNFAKKGSANELGIKAKHVLEDFHNYTKDVIKNFSAKEMTKEALDKFATLRKQVRFSTSMASFMAVGAFLVYLPKIYQLSKISPAEASATRARGEEVKTEGVANENK